MSTPLPLADPRLRRLRERLPQPGPGDAGEGLQPHGRPTARAAVAVVLREAGELELLLIKRALSERDPWSGHMALPGGRAGGADPSLVFTAVRETAEETGIILDPVHRLLGALEPVRPSTRRLPPLLIAPFVFATDPRVVVVPDPREVESTLWVPVDRLLEAGTRRMVDIPLPEGPMPFPAFVLDEHVVWGLTYRILDTFLRLVGD